MSTEANCEDLADRKSYAGIPEAEFVEDVDSFMTKTENTNNANKVLKRLDEQHSKYKFMEFNLMSKRKKLRAQIPDLKRSVSMIEKLQSQKDEFETEYLLSEQVFVKAVVPPTDTVCLWLGANVMLEYTLDDAKKLLTENIEVATKNLGFIEHDLDFLRDQLTTTEVNMARVYNWNVKKHKVTAEEK